ncbi:MAG: hypothetical protein NT159_21440 [Proteobacteria bacterium]|nr:hypothetical protein [Pseudomonadota bacterium]
MTHIQRNAAGNVRVCAPRRLSECAAVSLVLALSAGSSLAQVTHYYDGGNERTVTVQPGLVAEFASTPRATALSAKPRASDDNAVETPFVTIRNIDAPASLSAGVTGNQSPVFREGNSPAGRLMALPGGVIVNFNPGWSDGQVREWVAAHGYSVRHQLNIIGNWYVLDTLPGEVSLQTANAIQNSGDVVSASPNWWKETVTR